MPKYSFTSQKPPSLTWLAMSEPAPMATTSNSLLAPGMAATIGVMIPAAVTQAHGGRSDGDAEQRGDDPAEHQRREAQPAHRLRDRRIHAGYVEHAAEAAAGAHDQQHAGDAGIDSSAKRSSRSRLKPHAVPNV